MENKAYLVVYNCHCKYDTCQLRKCVTDMEYARLREMGRSLELERPNEAEFKCPLNNAKYGSEARILVEEIKPKAKEEPMPGEPEPPVKGDEDVNPDCVVAEVPRKQNKEG